MLRTNLYIRKEEMRYSQFLYAILAEEKCE